MLALALLWGSGCVHRTPVALAPSLEPISTPYQEQELVEVERCRPYLFGFIPLRPNYGMQDLVLEADQSGDGMVRVSVDQISKFWLIGYTTCHELHGTQVQFDRGSERAAAGRVGVNPLHHASTQNSARGTNDPAGIPASTYQITDTIYARIGRQKPTEEAEYLRDVQAVWAYGQRGLLPSELVAAAQRGFDALGAEAAISEILAAGVPTPP